MKNNRVVTVKTILWFIAGLASVAMIIRLFKGLGATTNLTDNTPWGLWIGFDVFSGVALAAGGFVVCALVYILHLEKYRPLARPAVLTAFLGYIAVAVGLFFDLGLPWRIWHPTIYWQHHSALFEVAWCVMLYLTVLLLEFSPTILEKIPFGLFPTILKYLKRFTIVFVLLGIMLSVLHQSSLGTLFMLMPSRIHPLWYSSIQPLLFFVSAVGLGMAMVTTESLVTSWLYNRKAETSVLAGLGRFVPYVLALYLLLRLGDLAYRNKLVYSITGSWESVLFIVEILISSLIPALLLAIPRIRKSKAGLLFASLLVILGFILHRIDVSIISSFTTTGMVYVPSLIEIATSLGIVSLAGLAFLFFVDNFAVYPKEVSAEKENLQPADIVSGDRIFTAGLGEEKRFSFFYILGASLMIFFLPENGLTAIQPEANPVRPALNVAIESLVNNPIELPAHASLAPTTNILLIDGNREGMSVLFNHGNHIYRNGGNSSCGICHHLNLPNERASECSHCHNDMYLDTDIFDHIVHITAENGNKGCRKCHMDPSLKKDRETSLPCSECHKKMKIDSSFILLEINWNGIAPGYRQAMHGLCLKCHEEKEKAAGKNLRTGISGCITCHKDRNSDIYATEIRKIE
jgi:Ni/Fe-hydrogenase subunit HybB-like protein